MKISDLVERLKLLHKNENENRARGGWGVNKPLTLEDSLIGHAVKEIEYLQERATTLEQLLQNIISAYCGHYADVDRVAALQRAVIEADEFLNA